MTKQKAALVTTAALIAAGVALVPAFQQSLEQHSMTTEELCTFAKALGEDGDKYHFFVLVDDAAVLPEAAIYGEDGRVLGVCNAGQCIIAKDELFGCSLSYTFECGPAIGGKAICMMHVHPYIAKGWWMAAESEDSIRWLGYASNVLSLCMEDHSRADCLSMLEADKRCWLKEDRSTCQYGMNPRTGESCNYSDISSFMPCIAIRGAGSEIEEAERVWDLTELDEI